MEIQDLVRTSRKFHSKWKGRRFKSNTYRAPDGYKCGIGCNLSDKELSIIESFSVGYAKVHNLSKRGLGTLHLPDNSIIREAIKQSFFGRQIILLQELHDTAPDIQSYLDELDRWEESGFSLNYVPTALSKVNY